MKNTTKPVIKLIASDLDGTLLQNGTHQLSPRAVPLIRQLTSQGILFTAASGRQYPNLYCLFGEAADQMAFICENGAYVVYRDKVIQKIAMDTATAHELFLDIQARDGCEALISGERTSYVMPKSPAFLDRIEHVVKNNVQQIFSFDDIPEPIIKVSVFEEAGVMEHSASYFISKWQDRIKCTVSGYGWLDFVHPSVNKGMALTALLSHLGLTAEQAMAFGDNYNDLEMLSGVKYGYVMENAVEDIRRRYTLSTASVEDTLQSLVSESDFML